MAEAKRDVYTVKAGDTLYSIATEHGVDYRELALWNGIESPGAIRVGQQLRMTAPPGSAVAVPLRTPGGVDARPLGGASTLPPGSPASPAPLGAPIPASPGAATAAVPAAGAVVAEPKGVRAPYSDQVLAQLSKADPPPSTPRPEVRAEPQSPSTPVVGGTQRSEPRAESGGEIAKGPDDLDWMWPTRGKVVGSFNDSTNKGIAIAGKLGQPIYASAPGRVIFSGTGIRGFGKLVVIKHNNTYLSVYAHNNELAVKEGQNVTKGQKIAEMGNSDADQVKLHFEIRRFGKPIDPMKLLPAG
jgi:lipoprotein NlpD